MPDANQQPTLDTNALGFRLNCLEAAWLAWRPGEPAPSWQQHLPADAEPCGPQLIFDLVQMDIAYRIRAGLPALLLEHYFEHPRLQRDDARLDDARQVELIHWEYHQRLQHGELPHRADYEAAFQRHSEALRNMKPQSRCPQCQKILVLEETAETIHCPSCGCESLPAAPPFVAPTAPPTSTPTELDPRKYELLETLGRGGMGEVYRCCDPALGRDLAIKIIRADCRRKPHVERRFLREARITGSLQHPGIVPVYNLGRFPDGRLHYTMRLVRGRTFADILKEEAGKAERLPLLLAIYEKICQAVAYAHSKRIIHRDLKPHNVMVGKFGEVQVMDWGLAKVLTHEDADDEAEEAADAAGTRIATAADTPMNLSRTGAGFGTPAYMPPEQALGEWDTVDERADVFALGSILCEMLTGEPAYRGTDGNEVYRGAKRGDVAKALECLRQCGADTPLTALCRECLSPRREDRPRDADAVAKRVAEHQAEVQERLRQAELERVAAETRAREEQARALVELERTREALARVAAEKRARRRTLALAAAFLLLVLFAVGGGLWYQRDRAARYAEAVRRDAEQQYREQQIEAAVAQAQTSLRHKQWFDAEKEVRRARGLVDAGDVASELRQAVDRVERDVRTIFRLEEVRVQRCGMPNCVFNYDKAPPDRVFFDYGIDVLRLPAAEAGRLIGESAIAEELVNALEDWAWVLREYEPEQRKAILSQLIAVAGAADPNSARNLLRQAMLSTDDALKAAVLALLPEAKAGRASSTYLVLLANVMAKVGQLDKAIDLLLQADLRYPANFWINVRLAELSGSQGKHRADDELRYWHVARSLRPDNFVVVHNLAVTYTAKEDYRTAEALMREAIRLRPDDPRGPHSLGNVFLSQGNLQQGSAADREALQLDPNYTPSLMNLGIALAKLGQAAEGEKLSRRAVALLKQEAEARPANDSLFAKSDEGRGFARSRYGLAPTNACLRSNYALGLVVLGQILLDSRKADEAEKAFQEAAQISEPLFRKYPDDAFIEASYTGSLYGLSQLCYGKQRYVAAVRLFANAFAEWPKLADDVQSGFRYNAAYYAALAAAGQGEDARLLPDKVVAMFRCWAFGWLHDDLTANTKLAERNNPATNREIQERLTRWRNDPALASVREADALNRLSETERAAWQALWRDVDELAKRMAKSAPKNPNP